MLPMQNQNTTKALKEKHFLRDHILDLLDSDRIATHFQPIYDIDTCQAHAYEALSRIEGPTIFTRVEDLFRTAIRTGVISSLDNHCRSNAIAEASRQGLFSTASLLFINVCPETMQDPAYRSGLTDEAVETCGAAKQQIVLELTENVAVRQWDLFSSAISTYRERGYSIAIDDFGAGYGGLKMLTMISPDYVKLDRHFISRIERDHASCRLVEALARLSAKLGFRLIAEGIETEAELATLKALDIHLVQGYHLARPEQHLQGPLPCALGSTSVCKPYAQEQVPPNKTIIDFVDSTLSIPPTATINDAFKIFMTTPTLNSLPVVKNSTILGVLNRRKFFEEHVLGNYGYGIHLNAYQPIEALVEQDYVALNALDSLHYVCKRLSALGERLGVDNICVVQNGRFEGTVSPGALVAAMTKRSLALARGANPLTGLPGNIFIQNEIQERLADGADFDVCYIDIDNFKPFNDHYGFERGDEAIGKLAISMQRACSGTGSDERVFLGHIGGDDFIIVSPVEVTDRICAKTIEGFAEAQLELHGQMDFKRGCYTAKNRKGDIEDISLLSLSIAVVNSVKQSITSYSHMASVACEVKKAAKSVAGNSVVRDLRSHK